MIARILIFLLLLITLPAVWLDVRCRRFSRPYGRWLRLLNSFFCVAMVCYTFWFTSSADFIPSEAMWLHLYLLLLAVLVVPEAVFTLCSLLGCLPRFSRWWCDRTGAVLALLVSGVALYGAFVGFRRLEIRHVEVAFDDLPKAFDGYRIVQFSDAHVGTYYGIYGGLLRTAVDSINAQHADAIVFTGDLQNIIPQEIRNHAATLRRLKARDGVFSVLGNHDYSYYVDVPPSRKVQNERGTQAAERDLGWTLLMNESRTLYRGNDSIVMAGMENDSKPPMPHRGDIRKTLRGVEDGTFVVMLQHDPSAWQRTILPHSAVQLTLSGHTHGGQMSLFGLRPTMLKYDNDYGLYGSLGRYLHVSGGLGGVIPFRIGMPGEVVVITLRSTHKWSRPQPHIPDEDIFMYIGPP